jgi:hypothetical protein
MSVNNFRPRKFEDFEILNAAGEKVGEIRVKPSGICWAGKGAHRWLGVSLDEFAAFMEKNGKLQKK